MKIESLDTWISCLDCGQMVGRDSIHTCSPQLKPLSDDEIDDIWAGCSTGDDVIDMHNFARAIEERHGIK